jgi:hypothetical protein
MENAWCKWLVIALAALVAGSLVLTAVVALTLH